MFVWLGCYRGDEDTTARLSCWLHGQSCAQTTDYNLRATGATGPWHWERPARAHTTPAHKQAYEQSQMSRCLSSDGPDGTAQMGRQRRQTPASHGSGSCESKTRVPAGLVSGEGPLSGLQQGAFSMCAHKCRTDRAPGLPLLTGMPTPSWGLPFMT